MIMYCLNCGYKIDTSGFICPRCGTDNGIFDTYGNYIYPTNDVLGKPNTSVGYFQVVNTELNKNKTRIGGTIMEKINDDALEKVNGGMVVYAEGLPEFDPTCPWEVVQNDNCRVLGKFATQAAACQFAKSFGPEAYNAQLTDIATVNRLRANPQGNG